MASSPHQIDEESLKADSAMCLAVARAISRREGHGEIKSFDCPDHHKNTAGAPRGKKFVDLTATTADGLAMALEHTLIESHERQMHEARQIERLLIPLQDSLVGRLPDDRSYALSVRKGAVDDRELDPADVQRAVGEWVMQVAPDLPAGGPTTAPNHFTSGGPPELPVTVWLYAWPPDQAPGSGRLTVLRGVAESEAEQEQARAERFARALNDKLPKLLEHRAARTILVLEDRDIATSNRWLAREAARTAAQGRELCDTIVLVESYDGMGHATIIRDEGNWVADLQAGVLMLTAPVGDGESPGDVNKGKKVARQ